VISAERQHKILEMIDNDGIVYTKDLIRYFNTSRETIRRDLFELEAKSALKRVYGGAVKEQKETVLSPFEVRKQVNLAEKKDLAGKVCSIVKENMIIAMDTSTTNLVILQELEQHFKTLTIITNSLPISCEASKGNDFNLIMLGGSLNKKELCFDGQNTINMMHNYHADLFLLSCSGVSLQAGVTDLGEPNLQVKLAMKEISEKTVLVCNHTRFETTALLRVCPLSDVDGIITDSRIAKDLVNCYAKSGYRITC
jgi:DeoR family fructose operon transcriptional repressor